MPALTTPSPAFTQALSALCRQHGYDEFVTAGFEPTTGRVLIATGPAQLTPAMQAILAGCHALRSTYQDRARPIDLDALEADSDEEESDTELPDDGYDLD